MNIKHNWTATRVTVSYRTDASASDVIREIEYNGGAFAGNPESVTITEVRRVRLENKPQKELDKEVA